MMLTSGENNKALEKLKEKLLERMNDTGILATYFMSPLSEITNPGNTSQLKIAKDSNSNRVKDLLLHNTIPFTLYNTLLPFRDTGKEIELKDDLSKMSTKKTVMYTLLVYRIRNNCMTLQSK